MTVTKAKTAEDLLMVFAELIHEFNSPDKTNGVEDAPQDLDGNARAGEIIATSTVAVGLSPPWANLAGIEETNLLYKMPPEVVAKMNWAMDNVPKMNRQRIVRDGVNLFLDALIAQHYKP